MGNIQVSKNGPQQIATRERALAPYPQWEPSRWFSQVLGWDPFREMSPFVSRERMTFEPAFDVRENKDSYVFMADVPGIQQKDLDISLTGNRLTVSGKREVEKEDKGDTYYAYERSHGTFARSFTLPEGVDQQSIRADMRDGVLSIVLPKKPEAQPKKIPVAKAQ